MVILENDLVNQIKRLSYPDFVGFLGQKNSPPGGMTTLKKWVDFAKISPSSYLLDLACSSGFSSRNIIQSVQCRAEGIDVSASSIEMAQKEAQQAHIDQFVTYQVADACFLPFDSTQFSHILGGCNFAFISDRERSLRECQRVLIPEGKLCIANFFYVVKPPEDLLDQVNEMIGFRPFSEWDYDWWNSFFGRHFFLEKEEITPLPVQSHEQLRQNVRYAINSSATLSQYEEEVREACFERLFNIRKVLNQHRKYQKFSLSIWKNV